MGEELKHLTHAVQYRGIPEGVSPLGWRTMAAFDQEHVAEKYADGCKNETWEYRVVPIPQPADQ